MAAMAVTQPPQPEPVNYSTEPPAASEDTMIGNDLIVEIPWIVFSLLLSAVCFRLRRFRRLSGRSGDRESRRRFDDDNASSADTADLAGNDTRGAAVSSSTQSSSTQASSASR